MTEYYKNMSKPSSLNLLLPLEMQLNWYFYQGICLVWLFCLFCHDNWFTYPYIVFIHSLCGMYRLAWCKGWASEFQPPRNLIFSTHSPTIQISWNFQGMISSWDNHSLKISAYLDGGGLSYEIFKFLGDWNLLVQPLVSHTSCFVIDKN